MPVADFPLLDAREPCAAWTPEGDLVVWVPGTLPVTQNARMHWAQRNRIRQDWDMRVRAALSSLPESPRFCAPVEARYELHYAGTARDETNAAGSVKDPEDSLVTCGVLPDDSPDIVTNTVAQVRVPRRADTGLLIVLRGEREVR